MATNNNAKSTTSNNESAAALRRQKRLEQYANLGLKIAFYRKKKGLSQLELSEKIDISRTYMSNIESPKCLVNPTLDVVLDIADALEVPVYKLFDDSIS